jgi:hypothetical protein
LTFKVMAQLHGYFQIYFVVIVLLILNSFHLIGILLFFLKLLKNFFFFFIRQNCTLELQSWSRSRTEIVVQNDELKPYINHPFIHTEWKLLNISVKPNEVNNFVWLEFTLHLKRNHAFYVNHMIFPFAILSSLSKYIFIG